MGRKRNAISIFLVALFSCGLLAFDSQAALVAHWTFDEGSGTQVVDNVGGLIGNLSATGASLVSGGKAGGALSLSKVDTGYVTMGDVLNLGTGPYSFVVWVKTSTTENTTFVMSKHYSGVTAGYLIGINNESTYGAPGKAWFYNLYDGMEPISTTSVNDDQWHQIIAVRGGNQVKIYVDGLPVEDSRVDQGLNDIPAVTPFLVGGYFNGSNPVSTYTGLIDDLQVYDHALTDPEVQWLYDHSGQPLCTPAPSGMVSWWKADGNANDSLGKNNGTLFGAPGFVDGRVDQAFNFDGSTQNMQVSNPKDIPVGNAPRTVLAWIKWNDNPVGAGSQNIFAYGSWGINAGTFFFERRNDTQKLYLTGYNTELLGNTIIAPHVWYLVAVTHDGTTSKFYVNGQEDGSAALTHNTIMSPEGIKIGDAPGNDGLHGKFNGLIDEVVVFNRALSQQEMAAIYAAGTGGLCIPICTSPPSGLISWWGGDNNALDLVGTNNGALHGTATFAPGIVGQAFSFDGGESNYVEIPDSSGLNPTGAFSVDGWFYLDPAASGNAGEIATLIAKTDGNTNNGWALYFDDRSSTKSLKFVLGSILELPNAIPTANWYHIAGVYDPAGTPQAKLYINGASATGLNMGGATSNNLTVRIGAMHWTDSYPWLGNDRLNGKADEVEFFNRALGADEIAAIYNAGSAGKCRSCTPPPSGMVAWWSGDNNALDLIGTNNGTLQGNATYAVGEVGQAFRLDGTNGYVQVPDSPAFNFGAGDFSLSLWVNYNAVRAGNEFSIPNAFLGQHGGSGYGSNKWSFYSADSGLYFHISNPTAIFVGPVPFTPQTEQWYYLSLTRTGATFSFYVNGILAGSLTNATSIPDVNAALTIGQLENLGYFNGLIDEIAIYNRALTADEVSAIYNASSAGMCSPKSLTVSPSGTGSGSVTGNGLNCAWNGTISSGTCSVNLTYNTAVILNALPSTGSTFSGWSGGSGSAMSCNGTDPCSFNITQASGVGSPFNLNTYNLTVTPSGTGSGSVTGNGLNCSWDGSSSSGTCNVSLDYNTAVSLTAAPNAGSTFSGWSGGSGSAAGCSSTGTCSFSISQASGVGVPFTLNTYNLTVTPSGTGSGSVTGNGLNCTWNGSSTSGTCSVSLAYDTAVSLTAAPNAGSTFSGWSGGSGSAAGCSSTGTCSFSITQASGAGAPFTLNTYNLTVTPSGTGSGSVTGNGLNCTWNGSSTSGTCSVSLAYDTAVSLIAAPDAGSTFNGWSGGSGSAAGCSGTGACSFSITQGSGVGSPFTLNTYNLTVTPSGTGRGSVTGNGIDCEWDGSGSSGTCSVSLDYSTAVSLTAPPSVGSAFSGWSGGTGSAAGCNGTGACTFTMTEASSIGSIFSRKSSIYLPLILRP